MKLFITVVTYLYTQFLVAQNVGIGTTTPNYNLNVHSNANFDVSIGLTNGLTTSTPSRGTRLRQVNSDFIISNYETTGKIRFQTNLTDRLVINENGNVDIGYIGVLNAHAQLFVNNSSATNTTTLFVDNYYLGGSRFGVRASILNDVGAAIKGHAVENGGSFPIEENVRYGILGITGNNGYSVGAYTLGGVALRAAANIDGLAISSTGKLKFAGIGEAEGKVLTSDVNGNASWQALPAASNAWVVLPNTNIYNNNLSNVGIGHQNPIYGLDVRSDFGTLFQTGGGAVVNNTVRILKNLTSPSQNLSTAALLVEAVSGNDGINVKSDNTGIYSTTTFASSAHYGVAGIATLGGTGVAGSSVTGTGVLAYSNSGHGVYSTSQTNFGIYGSSQTNFGIYGISTFADGVVGATNANNNYAGVHGFSTGGSYGVIGQSITGTGTAGTSESGIGLTAISGTNHSFLARKDGTKTGKVALLENSNAANNDNVLLINQFSTAAAIKIATSTTTGIDLENSSIKVTGTNKIAFQVTSAGANPIIIPNTGFANAATDILLVTHKGVSANVPTAVYVNFNGGSWKIYTENGSVIPNGEIYNVLVFKQ